MGQKYISENPSKYAIGKQTDVAIKLEANATNSDYFLSLKTFEAPNAPEAMMIEDAIGNRTTSSYAITGDRTFPFTLSGIADIGKIAKLIYLATGEVTSLQDGTTGAWKHTFKMRNNVILPKFTIFFSLGAEGYRRMYGCVINSLTVSVADTEATFTAEGLALGEDDGINTESTLDTLTITDVAYQTNGLTRYTFGSAPNLTNIKNGDVLNTEKTTLSTINRGKYIIVSVDNTGKTIDVLNQNRTSSTGDQTAITSTGNSIILVETPVYPTPEAVLLRRHSAVYDANDLQLLNSLTPENADGVRNFTFSITNNLGEIREGAYSANPSEIIAKNITAEASFTQIMNIKNAEKAKSYRENEINHRAYKLDLKDDDNFLGTSTNYVAQISFVIPKAHGVASRGNQHSNDELTYDWTLKIFNEQMLEITIFNTLSNTELLS